MVFNQLPNVEFDESLYFLKKDVISSIESLIDENLKRLLFDLVTNYR